MKGYTETMKEQRFSEGDSVLWMGGVWRIVTVSDVSYILELPAEPSTTALAYRGELEAAER